MSKITIYKGKLDDVIKQMKEDIKNDKNLASNKKH